MYDDMSDGTRTLLLWLFIFFIICIEECFWYFFVIL